MHLSVSQKKSNEEIGLLHRRICLSLLGLWWFRS